MSYDPVTLRRGGGEKREDCTKDKQGSTIEFRLAEQNTGQHNLQCTSWKTAGSGIVPS